MLEIAWKFHVSERAQSLFRQFICNTSKTEIALNGDKRVASHVEIGLFHLTLSNVLNIVKGSLIEQMVPIVFSVERTKCKFYLKNEYFS